MKIITDERCTGYSRDGHPERPARITATRRTAEKPDRTAARLGRAGQRERRANSPRPFAGTCSRACKSRRISTPTRRFTKTLPAYARASVAAALDALKAARAGENVFSLMRPPGHHATRDHAMGFCYLNNIAIAVLEAARHRRETRRRF